jgi:hypothetical protein
MPTARAPARRIDEASRSETLQPPANLPRRGLAAVFHNVLPRRYCVCKVDTGHKEHGRVSEINNIIGLHVKFEQDQLVDTTLSMGDHCRVNYLGRRA